jgi:flagellar protein FlbD
MFLGGPRAEARAAKGFAVIKLTRLDGEQFVLNAELIRYVEARPDTFVTLTTGERVVVREKLDEVMDRAVRYQQSKFLIPLPARSTGTHEAITP